MPGNHVQIPTANNIQFVPADIVMPPRYHFLPDDKQWYFDNLKNWQLKKRYWQPVQHTDRQFLQVHTNATSVTFNVYNDLGAKVVSNLTPDFINSSTGSIYAGDTLTVYQWQFTFTQFSLPDGIYYIQLQTPFADDTARYSISEPLYVLASHPLTTFIESTCNTNKEDVIFNFSGLVQPVFGLRLEAVLRLPTVGSDDVDFTEQQFNPRTPNATTWVAYDLYIGGYNQVAPYVIEKAMAYLRFDTCMINGYRYNRDIGSKFQYENDDYIYPLRAGSINVREYDRLDRITTTQGSKFKLFDVIGDFYAITRIDFNTIISVISNYIVHDPSENATLLAYLNSTIIPQRGLSGVFSYESSAFYYTNGNGENYSLGGTVQISWEYFTFHLTTIAANQTFAVDTKLGYGVFEWMDASSTAFDNNFVPSTRHTATHTFAAAATYNIRMYHDNRISDIVLNCSTFSGKLVNIGDAYPSQLQILDVYNADFSGLASGLNLNAMSRCAASIKEIIIENCALLGLDGTMFQNFPYSVSHNTRWVNLRFINFFSNQFSVSEVNGFLFDFYTYGFHTVFLTGTIDIRQFPSAAPTGIGAAAKAQLINQGWSIITN